MPPKAKRCQFSVNSLLIVITVVCVALSLYPILFMAFCLLAAALVGLFLFLITFQAGVFWLFEKFWPLPNEKDQDRQ